MPGVCELPRIKCGDCPNQAFLPFNDQAVLNHLQGRHVMGVYPLLSDETCWFLAVDFDKAAWKEDVASFTPAGSTWPPPAGAVVGMTMKRRATPMPER